MHEHSFDQVDVSDSLFQSLDRQQLEWAFALSPSRYP